MLFFVKWVVATEGDTREVGDLENEEWSGHIPGVGDTAYNRLLSQFPETIPSRLNSQSHYLQSILFIDCHRACSHYGGISSKNCCGGFCGVLQSRSGVLSNRRGFEMASMRLSARGSAASAGTASVVTSVRVPGSLANHWTPTRQQSSFHSEANVSASLIQRYVAPAATLHFIKLQKQEIRVWSYSCS